MSRRRKLRLVLLALATAGIIGTCAVFQVVVVPTASMESTVLVGDHLLVNRLAYRWKSVKRGDVISFYPPHKSDQVYLKRVVGIGGDRVEFREGMIFVNGAPLTQGEHQCSLFGRKTQSLIVPEGQLYVLGDNRQHSEDSRNWGTVAESRIAGAPVLVLWSFAIPTQSWMTRTPGAVYFDHPFAHLRWTRIMRPLQ